MSLPSIGEIVAIYSQSPGSKISQFEQRIFQKHGIEPLIPRLIEAYPHIRRSEGRLSILFGLVRYARTHQSVVSLAISALNDRAYLVREEACAILAYSLRKDVVPQLVLLQKHTDPRTKEDATAAIDAINQKNHHYFVDREHTGNTYWTVNPSDAPGRS